jgi:hypothetical protein
MKENLQAGDYILATKYHDGDPRDQWFVGFYSHAVRWGAFEHVRYMVVNGSGVLARANGFRRVRRISQRRGQWLLDHRSEIESGSKSLWWWARRPMKTGEAGG